MKAPEGLYKPRNNVWRRRQAPQRDSKRGWTANEPA